MNTTKKAEKATVTGFNQLRVHVAQSPSWAPTIVARAVRYPDEPRTDLENWALLNGENHRRRVLKKQAELSFAANPPRLATKRT